MPPHPHPHRHKHNLRLSHATTRIHFSLIAGISGNKGNERAASYGLIHQELIEGSLVSSADRAGVVLECMCVLKWSTLFLCAPLTLKCVGVDEEKMTNTSVVILRKVVVV